MFKSTITPGRILVVDDQKIPRVAVAASLGDAGHEVRTAGSGEEGLRGGILDRARQRERGEDARDTLDRGNTNAKLDQLEAYREDATGRELTTNTATKISDNQNTLKAGDRGPSLLEDFIMREKITHFDHERIPERVVHARGSAAHGFFQVYESLSDLTKADFLNDPSKKTPVFVRFSTVQGPRGSADTVRDVRGFATKFYTDEGNFDLVGNNMPVFFIQDAIKFPDFVHAVKPEPHNEIPTGQSAHDTFWDFVSLTPESAHMVLWTMSDRALPVHYRAMQGYLQDDQCRG